MNKYHVFAIAVIFLILGMAITMLVQQSKPVQEENTGEPGSVAQSHRGYNANVLSDVTGLLSNQPRTFRFRIINDKGEVLKNFSTVHERIMHLIVVRRDLQYFQHLHPTFNQATGEFSVDIIFPEDGPYRIFPDFTPTAFEDNPMQLPVTVFADVAVGTNYGQIPVVQNKQSEKSYGQYQVAFSYPKNLKSQQQVIYSLRITKNGKPVSNLENYLGAKGHSVVIKKDTLDLIHTHAMEAGMMGNDMHKTERIDMRTEEDSSRIDFSTTLPKAGIYKIFTQFRHNGKVVTTDYVVEVE